MESPTQDDARIEEAMRALNEARARKAAKKAAKEKANKTFWDEYYLHLSKAT